MIDIRPYSVDELKLLMEEGSGASKACIDEKFHSRYFEHYFGELGAVTILVERDYTDRDYLEDYAAYYVRCFHPYGRTCTRLHFFSEGFEEESFSALLGGEFSSVTQESLQAAYLGFIVIKPLPQTFIGRTCLKTYADDDGRRHYPIYRTYNVSLFGVCLSVVSLAFQEQDQVAGACATSALWSMFQGTGVTFQHHIPSPVEVSNYAERMSGSEYRRSPNAGLNQEQAKAAIRALGLEPRTYSARDQYHFCAWTYAYVKGKVPIFLGIGLYDKPESEPDELPQADGDTAPGSQMSFIGLHAVAVAGFSLQRAEMVPNGHAGFRLNATRMDKIYVHDDQVGPFARMTFQEVTAGDSTLFALDTSWGEDDDGQHHLAVPDVMIVPLYHKIRVPFTTILKAVYELDAGLKGAFQGSRFSEGVFWDIHLTSSSEIKKSILDLEGLASERRRDFLLTPLPRFMWKAEMWFENQVHAILLFDATDLEQGNLITTIVQTGPLSLALSLAASTSDIQRAGSSEAWKVWKWVNENMQPAAA